LEEKNLLVRTAKGATILSAQNFGNIVLGLIFFMVFARMVNKEEMGIYGTVYLFYMILTTIGILGLNSAASRFIAFFYGKGRIDNTIRTIKLILRISVISAFTFFFIQFIFSSFLSNLLFGTDIYSNLFKIASVATLFAILGFIVMGFLQGFQKFRALALFRFSSQIVRVVLSIILLFLGFGIVAVFVGYIVLHIIFILLALMSVYYFLSSDDTKINNVNYDNVSVRKLLSFSIPVMIGTLLIYLSDSIDRFIVLNLLGVEALGIYTVALTAVMSLNLFLVVPLQTSVTPGMTEIYAKAGIDKVSKSIKTSSRYVSMVLTPACVGFGILSPLAIKILAGQKYLEAFVPMSILALGLAIYGYSVIMISALIALVKTSRIAMAISFTILCELSLTFLLVPFFGLAGAAIGRSLAYVILLGLLLFFSSRIMKINLDKSCIVKSIIASAVMGCILLLATYYGGHKIMLTPLYIVIGLIFYFCSLVALRGITVKDVQLLFNILPGGQKILMIIERFVKKFPIFLRITKSMLKD